MVGATVTPLPTSVTTPAAPAAKPFYKQWWFWTVLGVGAAGLALGVGLGVASREPDSSGLVTYRLSPM